MMRVSNNMFSAKATSTVETKKSTRPHRYPLSAYPPPKQDHVNVHALTLIFFSTIFFCATQDIAVDGWALTLLSKSSLSYASTAQTVGLNTGYFLSFTVFLALNSAEFSNKYLRASQASEELGVLRLGSYLMFWAVMYFVITAWLVVIKKEVRNPFEPTTSDEDLGIKGVYTTIWKICKLPHMKSFILVLLTSKIGFIANEAVTGLKLLEKGFSKEDLALAVLIDFPFQILFGYYAAKWSSGVRPLKPWLYAFYGRLLFAALGMAVVRFYPSDGHVTAFYFWVIIASTVLSSFMSTVQFVSISAFMTTIADPVIGGTYMTVGWMRQRCVWDNSSIPSVILAVPGQNSLFLRPLTTSPLPHATYRKRMARVFNKIPFALSSGFRSILTHLPPPSPLMRLRGWQDTLPRLGWHVHHRAGWLLLREHHMRCHWVGDNAGVRQTNGALFGRPT
ncbi:acetyl-coenzyme A transporter 1-domain-containing protein [Jimgerdemannia flammicorona]|uniref:Acetyl-coenzyme A transporter 1-domain-containing protein n=1 Tax=Jimgerdemannia flammicorona TaxID=994334 RepID=A0A433DIZ9_9FUNG|nr:acetyl-coenzyme A transporter 1-domain-containing protein [Jimgerdemannia flammicorona]